jgi:DNA mismatch endonuclease (patch repair protein)
MALIRSKNSKAELLVFRYLRRNGIYFQKHYKRAASTPDIALPRKKRAVFIDGDFWHGRNYKHRLKGRDNDDYWVKKILRNIERDKQNRTVLIEKGWKILVVWESDIRRKRTQEENLMKIADFLKD